MKNIRPRGALFRVREVSKSTAELAVYDMISTRELTEEDDRNCDEDHENMMVAEEGNESFYEK